MSIKKERKHNPALEPIAARWAAPAQLFVMPKEIMMDSPQQLVNQLIKIFPEFSNEWDEGESHGYKGNYTYHCVFQEFAPVSHMLFSKATNNQITDFCNLINRMVEMGGDIENAVSTCFLEHASQVGVRKIIAPYLSKEAKKELG